MSALRQRRTSVLLGLAAGAALAGTTRATWISTRSADITGAARTVEVSGADAAPAVLALALVAVAAALATGLSGRWLRLLTGPALLLTGLAAAVAAVGAAVRPAGAAAGAVAEGTGVAGAHITAAPTLWPWAALGAAVLVALDGALVLVVGAHWRRTARYDREPEELADPAEDPAAAWDALSRGEDPTGPGDGHGDEHGAPAR